MTELQRQAIIYNHLKKEREFKRLMKSSGISPNIKNKNMVNNFEQIKKLLKFESDDEFYFLQIIKRKKEHPDMPKSVKVVATHYIYSLDKLEELKDEIIHVCNYHNARAYLNLNRRSFKRLAFQMLKQVTNCILNEEYRYIRKSYNTVCGRFSNESKETKTWIIDIDVLGHEGDQLCEHVDQVVRYLSPNEGVDKVITRLQTKNGWHLITKPFNTYDFYKTFSKEDIEIHKDNPTILYIPKEDYYNMY